MAAVVTATEYLTFDTVGSFPAIPMNTPAWEVLDYSSLYEQAPTVGGNRVIPGAPGRLPILREYDEASISLPLVVFGGADYEDAPYADTRIGVRANLEFLRDNVLALAGTSDGTRPVTFTKYDGSTITGDVIVESPLQIGTDLGPAAVRAVLRLVIPAGALT